MGFWWECDAEQSRAVKKDVATDTVCVCNEQTREIENAAIGSASPDLAGCPTTTTSSTTTTNAPETTADKISTTMETTTTTTLASWQRCAPATDNQTRTCDNFGSWC